MVRKANKHCGADIHESNIDASIVDKDDAIMAEEIFLNDVTGHIAFIKWLKRNKTYHVGMESTGVYWKALAHALISNGIKVTVGNAEMMKNVPGKKTDKLDARRIARLLRDGYIPESNVLCLKDEDFRGLVRLRIRLVKDRIAIKNRISAIIARVGLRLPCTDKFGTLGRRIMQSIAEGKVTEELFNSRKSTKHEVSKEQYLQMIEDNLTQSIRFQLNILLSSLDHFDEQIKSLEKEIMSHIHLDEGKMNQLEIIRSIPGFKDIASPIIIGEIGDISSFPTESKFSAYCGLVPTVYQSGEKEVDGITVKKMHMGRPRSRSNKRLKWIFITAAQVVARMSDSPLVKHLKDFYRRVLRKSRGRYAKQKAIVALAHKLAKIVWALLTNKERYHGIDGSLKIQSPIPYSNQTNNEPEKGILIRVMKALSSTQKDLNLRAPG